ncbi:hypothetical protein CLV59_107314 [Chitinophaga dinghuensis]|uniref:Esterase n=1 Tax=Chitinophaga dinghuensis TaxID=1539050 RepID=A0A327VT35_9BACT|nr:hypothetical protein [Chitinophaga dinghuensis]RAJ77547.1 hypothetical protein CLV59_107314 [Chitinophaga dinghuensis]
MKRLFLLVTLTLILPTVSNAQSFEQLAQKAGDFYIKNNLPEAFKAIKAAFQLDSNKARAFDYYTAARIAAKTDHISEAFSWLYVAQRRGLGREIFYLEYVSLDDAFLHMWKDPRWEPYVKTLEQDMLKKKAEEQRRREDWKNACLRNAAAMKEGHLQAGFALYYNKVDTLEVPYQVYVPKSINTHKKHKLIVFLHGGVVDQGYFGEDSPSMSSVVPIFQVADSLGAIVLYPFARKDFGWWGQLAAFQNVVNITKVVTAQYPIDPKQIVMVGDATGGTALFWYATQPESLYKGYLAISATPKLEIGEIAFSQITPDKHFYSINATDDRILNYKEIHDIYSKQRSIATGWHFETVNFGGYNIIFRNEGPPLILKYLKKIFAEK